MAIRVNPKLIDELEAFGAEDVSKCYHCGNCSAMCPFSKETNIIPRRSMRYLQMGLEKKLESSLEPWLCYYCGECSESCPRDAEPGETMMSLRRWLTSRYDFTGISRLFYRSGKFEIIAVVVAALLTGLGFILWGMSQGSIYNYDPPNAFLPDSGIHIFDWVLAGVLLVLLITNCIRMWWFTIGRDKSIHVPFTAYIRHILLLPYHFLTQRKYAQCERKRPWAIHLGLVLSYVTMLILIMFFLGFMQSGPDVDWRVHVFGYLATVGLLGSTIFFLNKRLRKQDVQYKQSHETDWIFLVLLIMVAFTGILQHILHRAGLDVAANVVYIIHLMGVVPMLALEVPFSKWAHLAYRPLALFFNAVRADAVPVTDESKSPVPAPQIS
jgi:quinone-modifying oxidoreductase, subunit QmoC